MSITLLCLSMHNYGYLPENKLAITRLWLWGYHLFRSKITIFCLITLSLILTRCNLGCWMRLRRSCYLYIKLNYCGASVFTCNLFYTFKLNIMVFMFVLMFWACTGFIKTCRTFYIDIAMLSNLFLTRLRHFILFYFLYCFYFIIIILQYFCREKTTAHVMDAFRFIYLFS